MLRRPRASRRPLALLTPLALVAALGTACGDETTVAVGGFDRTEAFEISGDAGSAPEVTWNGRMDAEEAETEVVAEGEGAELAEGDQVLVNYYVGNGFTRSTTLDTYAEDEVPTVVPVGGEVAQPTSAQPSDEEIVRYLLDVFVAEQVTAGDTVGSRKVSTVTSADIVGVAGGVLDIGNEDALMVVIDLESVVKTRPDGSPIRKRAAWVPGITFDDGTPTGLDFSKAADPDGTLKTAVLYQGEGPEVGAEDLIVVDYLGSVFDAAKPFDSSYERETFTTALGRGAVIKGWDDALAGVNVGSRVMLQIPPNLGYGKQGSGENIPGGSTLYFVIDVLAAG